MSFHSRSIVPPPRRSTASSLSSSLRSNRPRSTGHLSSSNPYSSYSGAYSSSDASSYLGPSTSSYSSYQSPSSRSYHSPVSTSYASTPSYLNPTHYKSSYVRSAASRLSPSRYSGIGSRSGSSTSLTNLSTKSGESEGYVSEDKSRVGSVSSLASSQPEENGEVDYKKLYEEEHATNERLRDRLRKTEDELSQVKTSRSPMSEVEKRERRAMERKLSEMEEELKVLAILKNENQRLKDENGALIRVISKLSK